MIEDADFYLEEFRSAGADRLTVHYEACRHLHRTVQRIKQLGAQAGVCINPATPVQLLAPILPDVDLVLLMTVNPGFGGQSFIPGSLGRIREAAAMIQALKPGVHLEVDGGIDSTTAKQVVDAGANVLVSGNYVFGSPDIGAAIRTLRTAGAKGVMA
jgi:ribulose-phosphate 3-epimerase